MEKIRKLQSNQAITMIALIITIIIMLILIGTTVSLVIRGNLIEGTLEATDKYKNKLTTEISEIDKIKDDAIQTSCSHKWNDWITQKQATCYEGGRRTRTCSSCEEVETENFPRLAHVFEQGACTLCEHELVMGASIEGYDPTEDINENTISTSYSSSKDITGYSDEQTFTVTSITDWQVLGEEGGQLIITPTTPINSTETGTYYLKGKLGYQNGINELNKISGIYGQGKYADKSKYTYVLDGETITSGSRTISYDDLGYKKNTTTTTKTYTKNETTGKIDTVDMGTSNYVSFVYWGENANPNEGEKWITLASGKSVVIEKYSFTNPTLNSLQYEMFYGNETDGYKNYWAESRTTALFKGYVVFYIGSVEGKHKYIKDQRSLRDLWTYISKKLFCSSSGLSSIRSYIRLQ